MTLRMTDSPNVYRWAEKQRAREKERMKIFDDMKAGLEEALAYEEGRLEEIKRIKTNE